MKEIFDSEQDKESEEIKEALRKIEKKRVALLQKQKN